VVFLVVVEQEVLKLERVDKHQEELVGVEMEEIPLIHRE
jgi:hypothetical protein